MAFTLRHGFRVARQAWRARCLRQLHRHRRDHTCQRRTASKARRVDHDEERAKLARPLQLGVHRRNMRAERIAVQRPAQQFDHHRQPVALVAVFLAAQGPQCAHLFRIGAILALRIQRHTRRQGHAVTPRVHDAVPRNGGGGHVQAQRLGARARERQRNGVGAKERLMAAERRGDGIRMREGDADQALARRRAAIQAHGAAVRRIADADGRDARLARKFDGKRIGAVRHHNALPLSAMQLRGAGAGTFNTYVRLRQDGALRDAVQVMRQPRDAVGINAPQAGLRQAGREAARIIVGKALHAQAIVAPAFPLNGVHSAFRMHAALLKLRPPRRASRHARAGFPDGSPAPRRIRAICPTRRTPV